MSEKERASKRPRLAIEEDKTSVAGPSNDQSQPKIYKLNIDCFDEIFEYLSLHDLHSFGQTCKAMQKVAGEYFRRNFSTAATRIDDDGLRTNVEDTNGFALTSGFNNHIKHILLNSLLIGCNYLIKHIHEFKSINEITFTYAILDKILFYIINGIFPQLEIIRIKQSYFRVKIYEQILKFCVNLKRLHLEGFDLENEPLLRQTYPKLEHLAFIPIESIDDLIVFFQKNPQLKSFSTDTGSFEKYKDQILKFDVKLDLLELNYFYGRRPSLKILGDLLNQLHEHGFYRRLHFHFKDIDAQACVELPSLRGLEKLNIDKFHGDRILPPLPNLKEFHILDDISSSDAELMANNFMNLERLTISKATHENILLFIQRTRKLCKIKLTLRNKSDIIKLVILNKEREKLLEARKVTIYISEFGYLNTKWATKNGDINLKFIELKRMSSYE